MTGTQATRTGAATKPRPRPVTRKRQTGSVTRKSQDGFTTVNLLAALEAAWLAIRSRHVEVPAVVIVVGSGTTSKQAKLGHYAAMRWQHGKNRLPEVLISGEGLQRPPSEVFTTLLHEATHALADVRGIKDTSRQGRWHNKQFAALAGELGLDTTKDPRHGYMTSSSTLRDETATTYASELKTLTAALSAYRHPEILTSKSSKSNNALACVCGCERRIRVARSVLELGIIICGLCGAEFIPDAA